MFATGAGQHTYSEWAVLSGRLWQPLLHLKPWGQLPEIAGRPVTQFDFDKLRSAAKLWAFCVGRVCTEALSCLAGLQPVSTGLQSLAHRH